MCRKKLQLLCCNHNVFVVCMDKINLSIAGYGYGLSLRTHCLIYNDLKFWFAYSKETNVQSTITEQLVKVTLHFVWRMLRYQLKYFLGISKERPHYEVNTLLIRGEKLWRDLLEKYSVELHLPSVAKKFKWKRLEADSKATILGHFEKIIFLYESLIHMTEKENWTAQSKIS